MPRFSRFLLDPSGKSRRWIADAGQSYAQVARAVAGCDGYAPAAVAPRS